MVTKTSFPFDYLKNCHSDISDRFSVTSINNLQVSQACGDRLVLTSSPSWLSELVGKYIYIYYAYASWHPYRMYSCTVKEILNGNTIVCDSDIVDLYDYSEGNMQGQTGVYSPWSRNYQRKLDIVGYGNHQNSANLTFTIGKYSFTGTTITVRLNYFRLTYWGNTNQTLYPDGHLFDCTSTWLNVWLYSTSAVSLFGGTLYGSTQGVHTEIRTFNDTDLQVDFPLIAVCGMDVPGWGVKYKVEYSIEVTSITNCRGEEVPATGSFISIPCQDYLYVIPTDVGRNGLIPSNVAIVGNSTDPGECPHASNGAKREYDSPTQLNTISFETSASDCWDATIDYKLNSTCSQIEITYDKITNLSLKMIGYYTDDDSVDQKLDEGSQTFPFNVRLP